MKPREAIVNEVKRILHGPINGEDEILDKNPLDFYSTGILYPQLINQNVIEDSIGELQVLPNRDFDIRSEESLEHTDQCFIPEQSKNEEEYNSTSEDDFMLTTQFRPSASGISVLINKEQKVSLKVGFASYEKILVEDNNEKGLKTSNYKYKRNPFTKEGSIEVSDRAVISEDFILDHKHNIYTMGLDRENNYQLKIVLRNYNNKSNYHILTVTLANTIQVEDFKGQKDPTLCIFQPVIDLKTQESFLPFQDNSDLSVLDEEEINTKLLYKNYKCYGMGHGISVNWVSNEDRVSNIFSQVIPEKDVNGVETNPEIFKDTEVLFMKCLAGDDIGRDYCWDRVKTQLEEFVNLYLEWIQIQKTKIDINWPDVLKMQANKNLKKCESLSNRMNSGINILDKNINARKAFEDANKAMFMQRVMADFSNHRRNSKRVLCDDDKFDDKLPDFSEVPYNASNNTIWENGSLITSNNDVSSRPLSRWRPFQLAFLLSQIEGITDAKSEDRNTVDLIWFPTGGGKTEAYLGLIAMTIFYRRLFAKNNYNDPDLGAGVTVLMRYTLRLLNKQQFERASILICACELIRKNEINNYGKIRITNGIWMGRSMTPNNISTQISDYQDFINSVDNKRQPNEYKNSPPLLSCPCCGNRLIRENEKNEVIGRWGYIRPRGKYNSAPGSKVPFSIVCTNSKCEFYTTEINFSIDKTIPVLEVDEIIYKERPSLLFSTVDKFVTLAWKDDAFNLFNLEFEKGDIKRKYPAPELIIQDELHLISSSLGTIYGVYEIAIDHLCKNPGGQIVKIIGATATVKRAEEQTKRLYARAHFMQFPPPAIDADDSFYSVKKQKDDNARKYVGFMPSGITTSTALIRLTAVLLERVPSLSKFSNTEIDPYYTLIVYFNALKELGKFRTFLTDDIVAYRKVLSRQFNTFFKPYNHDRLCELSSVMNAEEITKGLDRLEKTCLQDIPDSDLVRFLSSVAIRNLKDVEIGTDRKKFITNKDFFQKFNIKYTEGNNDKANKENYANLIKKLKESGFNNDNDPIQIAPATSMISVGVDVPRLNIMVINGQPKTTSEYIQSSSRIGREKPGVVFTFLAPTKNRDRSHYEQFSDFHQSYYKYVESSSVTPFSKQALEKVVPTVLVTLCRSLFLKCNNTDFFYNSSLQDFLDNVIKIISTRASDVNPNEPVDTLDMQNISNSFKKLQGSTGRKFSGFSDFLTFLDSKPYPTLVRNHLVYNAPAQFVDIVLTDHIPTIQSLRNVEPSTKISIK